MKGHATAYFAAFAAKDLDSLTNLLAPDVTLRDWGVAARGRDAVLKEMQAGFQSFTSIQVKPLNIYCEGSTVVAELDIRLDSELIKVVDILEFNADAKIAAIRAFKG